MCHSNYAVRVGNPDTEKRKIEEGHSNSGFRNMLVVGQCTCWYLSDRFLYSDEFTFQI